MAGGGDYAKAKPASIEVVAVPDTMPVEVNLVARRKDVRRAGSFGEFVTACHVVVVKVRLDHDRTRKVLFIEHFLDPVDVPLGINDDSRRAVVGDVAAIAEFRRLEGFNIEHAHPSQADATVTGVTVGRIAFLHENDPDPMPTVRST